MIWLMVALGGGAGSVLRYWIGRLAVEHISPTSVLATFVVNVSGSFILGFFMTLALERLIIPLEVRNLVTIGFLGGYTTFSTLSYESIRLIESGEVLRAGASLLGNVIIGLIAAYLGMVLGRVV
jgi:CrcB protein